MNDQTLDSEDRKMERQRQAAFRRLGTDHPVCIMCGETYWGCLEEHHIGGKAFDDSTGNLCRNCHRKLSHPWENQAMPQNPPIIERIGNLLIGLAEFLMAIAAKLKECGRQLLDAVAVCPPPFGALPEVSQ